MFLIGRLYYTVMSHVFRLMPILVSNEIFISNAKLFYNSPGLLTTGISILSTAASAARGDIESSDFSPSLSESARMLLLTLVCKTNITVTVFRTSIIMKHRI